MRERERDLGGERVEILGEVLLLAGQILCACVQFLLLRLELTLPALQTFGLVTTLLKHKADVNLTRSACLCTLSSM